MMQHFVLAQSDHLNAKTVTPYFLIKSAYQIGKLLWLYISEKPSSK